MVKKGQKTWIPLKTSRCTPVPKREPMLKLHGWIHGVRRSSMGTDTKVRIPLDRCDAILRESLALTSDAAWVIANIVAFRDAQEDTPGGPWWNEFSQWWDELGNMTRAEHVEVEEKKRNGRWGRPGDL